MTDPGRDDTSGRRIRLGMVGGGQGAFIGAVHRIAARLDDRFELVAGALSSTPEKARASGEDLGLDDDRNYSSYEEMAESEARREDGIEAVAIATPNATHLPVARAFLEHGIHVLCDKPMTTTLAEAEELAALVEASGRLFVLTHNYSGYPMIRQAREMVAAGELGALRVVQVEYAQDWLATPLEEAGNKQAGWRTDPARAGAGGCVGDIGTHAYQLACFVSGLEVESLAADLTAFVPGRRLDDNAHVLLRFKGGARGMLWASQVAIGSANALTLRVYGETGGLDWRQESPDDLWFTRHGEPPQRLRRGGADATPAAARVTRIPAGHPEGYLEAFANLYREAADAILAAREGKTPRDEVTFPSLDDGIKGMAFIEACVRSSDNGAAWVEL